MMVHTPTGKLRMHSLNISTLQQHFADAPPQTVLAWAADTFESRFAVVTSFQKTGVVTLHMLCDIAPATPILTLDTGNLFPETNAYIDQLSADWNLNLIRIFPPEDVPADLWQTDPDRCCALRKVEPLNRALRAYDAWVAGIRRDQSNTRANVQTVSLDHRAS
jgi:phosphoadenosine phosphosulfate reductase